MASPLSYGQLHCSVQLLCMNPPPEQKKNECQGDARKQCDSQVRRERSFLFTTQLRRMNGIMSMRVRFLRTSVLFIKFSVCFSEEAKARILANTCDVLSRLAPSFCHSLTYLSERINKVGRSFLQPKCSMTSLLFSLSPLTAFYRTLPGQRSF